VQDKAGHRGGTGGKLSEGSKSHLEKGGGSSKGGNGGVSGVGERQRRPDKGKAKVQDSWCAGLFGKAVGSRRRMEEREKDEHALREAQELHQGRLFEQQERALEGKKKFRRKEKKRISEMQGQFKKEVEQNPRLGKLLKHTQKFLAGWPLYVEEHKGVPDSKLWVAYVADDSTGAACYGAAVDPAEHLPQMVNGSSTPCRLCDQIQPLEARRSVWARIQQLWEQAKRARDQEEQAAAAKAAKAKAQAVREKRRRKAEAWKKRRAEEAARPEAPKGGR
jgi:hypothetical protein